MARPEPQRLTGVKKRQQIEVAGRTMFVWIAIAAVSISLCVATGQFLFGKWAHNNKVISAKDTASKTLDSNLKNIDGLILNVDALVANQALASVKTNPNDSNTKSVLDALPTTFDPAALGTSLQQVILNRSGVTIENIVVPQDSGEVPNAESVPQEMVFNFVITGQYSQVQQAIVDVERTIRPIKITSINLTGSDTDLRASVEATTYYQPSKTVKVGEEVVQ